MGTRYKKGDKVKVTGKKYIKHKGIYGATGTVIDVTKSKVDKATVYLVKLSRTNVWFSASEIRKA
jgi:ribosomal protein L20